MFVLPCTYSIVLFIPIHSMLEAHAIVATHSPLLIMEITYVGPSTGRCFWFAALSFFLSCCYRFRAWCKPGKVFGPYSTRSTLVQNPPVPNKRCFFFPYCFTVDRACFRQPGMYAKIAFLHGMCFDIFLFGNLTPKNAGRTPLS